MEDSGLQDVVSQNGRREALDSTTDMQVARSPQGTRWVCRSRKRVRGHAVREATRAGDTTRRRDHAYLAAGARSEAREASGEKGATLTVSCGALDAWRPAEATGSRRRGSSGAGKR